MNGGKSNGNGLLFGGLFACLLVAGGGFAYWKFVLKAKAPSTGIAQKPQVPHRPRHVGPTPGLLAKPVRADEAIEVPFIFWGGDVATFHANGGLDTTKDSQFGKLGIKCKLEPGDDFDKQVEKYKKGTSPFLRGTLSMLGQVSEDLVDKDETMPVVFLQLTWSAGDHLVGREGFAKLQDLRGKKIAIQGGGPHVGMLNDLLLTTRLGWNDINVVWTKDVSGDNGPAALFRKDSTIDACFAISPEMFELTSAPADGGIDSKGDGTKKSIKGAHVVVSTQHMSRSIADVYACRRDFYDANRPWIDKFVAGYLKSVEELVDAKKRAGAKEPKGIELYKKDIKYAQDIWGKDPAVKDQVAKDDDVDGLISDATFVGLPGNEAFFKKKGNLAGFDFKQKQALKLPGDPSKDPLKNDPMLFEDADLDYSAIRTLGSLNGKAPTQARFSAELKIEPEQMIYTFAISFKPNQHDFSVLEYGDSFQRALEIASLFGNTALVIQGHADPSNFVREILDEGAKKGVLTKLDGTYATTVGFKTIDPNNVKSVIDLVDSSPGLREFRGADRELKKLSNNRANEVHTTMEKYARERGLVLDPSQFRTEGLGISRPIRVDVENRAVDENRRVEFSIMKVPLDKLNSQEFDL